MIRIALRKWFLLIYKCNHSLNVDHHLECYKEKFHCHHGTGNLTCHQKWGSKCFLQPNIVDMKSQHHRPCFIPLHVSGKLTELHSISLFLFVKELFIYYLPCKMNILPCSIEPNTYKMFIQKCVNINYA